MTKQEEEFYEIGKKLIYLGERLMNYKDPDLTGLGMRRIVIQNIEMLFKINCIDKITHTER